MESIVAHRELVLPISRAHAVALDGVCSVDGGPDVACCAIQMSLTSVTVRANALVKVGDAITLQLPQIGIVEALAVEAFPGGFVLSFEPAPRSKLGTYVSWLGGGGDVSGEVANDGRAHERIVPIKRLTSLQRGDLPPSLARIVDLSRSGAAFTCSQPLEIGEHVGLGACGGSVVRLIEGGAAVRFDALIDEQHFGVMIDLDVARAEPPVG